MSGPSPPLLQINQIHQATLWGGVVWDNWSIGAKGCHLLVDILETKKISIGWNRDPLPAVSSARYFGQTSRTSKTQDNTELQGELLTSPNCSQRGYFHAGPDIKSQNIKRCSDSVVGVSIILALMAPSLNHGEAANCQPLCPHYPRPPAQTGALGHCPRNLRAPVASGES